MKRGAAACGVAAELQSRLSGAQSRSRRSGVPRRDFWTRLILRNDGGRSAALAIDAHRIARFGTSLKSGTPFCHRQ